MQLKGKLKVSGMLLGILGQSQTEYLRSYPQRIMLDESKVEQLIEARSEARRRRNFSKADSIREELTGMGVEIEDHKDGTTSWKTKTRVVS